MKKLGLFPYQDEGSSIMAANHRFGLHDEMGVGKTATTVSAINKTGGRRGLVVGPAGLRENFIGEYKKFSTYPLRMCKGNTIHDYVAWKRGRFDVLVTSYEQATRWYPHFAKEPEVLDFVAMDEAHYLKTLNTGRTTALLGVDAEIFNCWLEWAIFAWWITGTPVPNDPADVYTFLRFCEVMPLSFDDFTKRYFVTERKRFGSRQYVKREMVPELKTLVDNNRIRRTMQEVGIHLPPVFLTTSLVDGDTREIKELLQSQPGLEDIIMHAVQSEGGLSTLEAPHVAMLRRLLGTAKAVPYAKQLEEELKSTGGKRVVYGISRDALRHVYDHLNSNGVRAVLVQGGVSDSAREDAVRAFQNDPECQCFIGNIRAAGEGITLTASCELDMLESDWTPAKNAQAIKRIHRIGQEQQCRARFITLAKSFDERVTQVVADKVSAIAELEGSAMVAAPSPIDVGRMYG